MARSWILPCLCIAILTMGCSQAAPPLEGTVTLDGKPLSAVTVMLIEEASDGTRPVQGTTNSEGVFQIMNPDSRPLAAGRYKVVVVAPRVPNAKHVPSIYREFKNSPLTVEIPPPASRIDVALRSK